MKRTALDDALSALADPTRRRVVDLLGQGPCPAGELARGARTSATAMSQHLRVLKERGIVEEERDEDDARVRVYRLRPDSLRRVSTWLERVASHWEQQLDSFRDLAESRARSGKSPRGRGR